MSKPDPHQKSGLQEQSFLSHIVDLRILRKTDEPGIIGVVTGRAIYEGSMNFAQGQKLADQICPVAE